MERMRYILTILTIFIGEFFWKNHVEKNIPEGGSKKVLHDTVILTKYHNRGAALNTGEKRPEIVKWISLVLTAAAAVLFRTGWERHAENGPVVFARRRVQQYL